MVQELLQNTKVVDIMSAPVVTVKDTDDFYLVQDKFETHGIRHLPVIDAHDRIVGLISQRHLYKIHSPQRLENGDWFYDKDLLNGFILKNVMVKELFVLKANACLRDAMQAMMRFKYGCIPIVDGINRPLGIVTRDNVIRFFFEHA